MIRRFFKWMGVSVERFMDDLLAGLDYNINEVYAEEFDLHDRFESYRDYFQVEGALKHLAKVTRFSYLDWLKWANKRPIDQLKHPCVIMADGHKAAIHAAEHNAPLNGRLTGLTDL